MFSEGVHSLVDTANELLLIYGYKRSNTPPDRHRPFGYGRELYFWSFVVSVLIFAGGSGVAIYDGVARILAPEPIQNFTISYCVLAASFLFDGISWWFALSAFQNVKGDAGYWETARDSKDPSLFLVLFEDSAALIGVVLAAAGLAAAQLTGIDAFDGVASIAIGLVLLATGGVLARESKGPLIGERADPQVVEDLVRLAESEQRVEGVNGTFTVHIGPEQIMVAMSLEFADALCTQDIEATVVDLEHRIRTKYPAVTGLFIKPQTKAVFERHARDRIGSP